MRLLVSISLIILILCACVSTQPKENKQLIINEETLKNEGVFSMIEPLWWSVSIYDGEKQYYEDLKKYSDPQKYVFAIQWYLSEVNNGGHDQFYFNSTGIVWEEAMIGFKTIGLDECYEIIKQSAKMMGGKPSKDREKRQEQLDKYQPNFEDLDNKVYEIEDIIDRELIEYIRLHMKYFEFKG